MTVKADPHNLDYVPITGAGVDMLDRRKERNNAEAVTAEKLQTSIDKVKAGVFNGFKLLALAASRRTAAR